MQAGEVLMYLALKAARDEQLIMTLQEQVVEKATEIERLQGLLIEFENPPTVDE